jgi:hypothetical protein
LVSRNEFRFSSWGDFMLCRADRRSFDRQRRQSSLSLYTVLSCLITVVSTDCAATCPGGFEREGNNCRALEGSENNATSMPNAQSGVSGATGGASTPTTAGMAPTQQSSAAGTPGQGGSGAVTSVQGHGGSASVGSTGIAGSMATQATSGLPAAAGTEAPARVINAVAGTGASTPSTGHDGESVCEGGVIASLRGRTELDARDVSKSRFLPDWSTRGRMRRLHSRNFSL